MIEHAFAELEPAVRAALFDDLGRQNADTRPGVGLIDSLPDILWRRVPAGSFWMGGDPLALGAWTGRHIDLDGDRWLAAYPVTVRQYQAFIDAGGYTEALSDCWPWVGLRWKQRYNTGDGLTAPLGWDSPFRPARISNHPVEVDWYEAVAFAAWLERLRRDGVLMLPPNVPHEYVIRLPDEAEREWAARYPDSRVFPWGDAFVEGAANIDETDYYERVGRYYLSRISPVGIYLLGRQSALDLYDMGGNVSEWCQTVWQEARYSADNDAESIFHRVVRGGHYHNRLQFARGASRTWGDPDPDDQYDPNHGFRVAIGPPFVAGA